MKRAHSSLEVRDFIIQNVEGNPNTITHLVTQKFGISRQSVHRYLHNLISDGLLEVEGRTRDKIYRPKVIREETFYELIVPESDEAVIWRSKLRPLFEGIKDNVIDICQYGFTEMLNNVIDHSESKSVVLTFRLKPNCIEMWVEDEGIGIFNKITKELGLEDHRHAVLELSKGKLTTDRERHTGEGIFYTSRLFDEFGILSGNLCFSHEYDKDDWLLETAEETKGTFISMKIGLNSKRTLKEIFDKFSSSTDDYGFTRTHVPVALVRHGNENLVSRSQAKRLLARLEPFREVFLDFKGVEFIGQAFADEIFRVFKNSHPDIEIIWINTNDDIKKMINRPISMSADIEKRGG